MKKILTFILLLLAYCQNSSGQPPYFAPTPADVTEPVRLYVFLNTGYCSCPELFDADSTTNPLYLWTWIPFVPRPEYYNGINISNGDWDDSNENMRMHQDPNNPNLWYYDFLDIAMDDFFGTDAETLYTEGINFVLKEKNGAPPDSPEQKSQDMSLTPTFINSVFTVQNRGFEIMLYPNPSAGNVVLAGNMDFSFEGLVAIKLLDMRGRLMSESRVTTITEEGIQLDYSQYPAGIYMVQVSDDKSILSNEVLVLN